MSTGRLLEIALYSALNFVPYYLLLLHPFWDRLRFSALGTTLAMIVAGLGEFGLGVYVVLGGNPAIMFLVRFAIGILFCMVAIRDRLGKTAMTFAILFNFCMIINMISKYFEGFLFPAYAGENFHWTFCVIELGVGAIFLLFDLLYSVKVYAPVLSLGNETRIWRFLWLIPMTFVGIWYVVLFNSQADVVDVCLNLNRVLTMSMVTAGAFVMDYTIAILIREQANRLALEEKTFLHSLEQRQYQSMNKRVEDARRARHDLRHHLQIATMYLNDNKIEELKAYLSEYQSQLPNDTMLSYCPNFTVNALLAYYDQRLMEREIRYDVVMDVPESPGIPDYDLAVIFGNLLENAADASMEARQAGKEAWVKVWGQFDGKALMLRFENTVAVQPQPDSKGRYLSTKHTGYGIGISSVRTVAEEYGGSLAVTQEGDTFCVSVLLLGQEKTA